MTTVPAAPSESSDKDKKKDGFAFTDPGCRWDVRLGVLLVLAAVFLWLWLGPAKSSRLYLLGAPFLLYGVPMQAFQARRDGRPGFPWKVGLTMTIGGLLMWPDLMYQESITDKAHVQPVAYLLVIAGAWILAWWPLARRRRDLDGTATA
jgi:hypothetical protein